MTGKVNENTIGTSRSYSVYGTIQIDNIDKMKVFYTIYGIFSTPRCSRLK